MDTTIVKEVRSFAGDGIAHAGRQALRTREGRALRLYEMRGSEIQQVGEGVYWVPSWDGEREHVVRYPVGENETETCSCPDHAYRGAQCMHILCAAIYAAKKRQQRRRNFIHAFVVGEDE